MKFIGEKPTHKTVLYFGIALFITSDINWIAVDENGDLDGYELKPYLDDDHWQPELTELWSTFLGKVDLEGMDWRNTLLEV